MTAAQIAGAAAKQSSRTQSMVLALLMLATALLSAWFLPRPVPDAQARASVPLEDLFPVRFGDWQLEPAAAALVRPAFEQARRFQMYDQLLERTYINAEGQRVMLSVAYGRQQSVGLQMHRPEVCYRAGGFKVEAVTPGQLRMAGRQVPVTRLLASMPGRPEPITYWRLLGDEAVSGETQFKFRQLALGMRGQIPDGMLVRLSSIDGDPALAYERHAVFARQMAEAMTPGQRMRTLGF